MSLFRRITLTNLPSNVRERRLLNCINMSLDLTLNNSCGQNGRSPITLCDVKESSSKLELCALILARHLRKTHSGFSSASLFILQIKRNGNIDVCFLARSSISSCLGSWYHNLLACKYVFISYVYYRIPHTYVSSSGFRTYYWFQVNLDYNLFNSSYIQIYMSFAQHPDA